MNKDLLELIAASLRLIAILMVAYVWWKILNGVKRPPAKDNEDS